MSTQCAVGERSHSTPAPPNASEVRSVKLRRVGGFRSPGGTPLRVLRANKQMDLNDPASIIAEALRRKFSNKVYTPSPSKSSPGK